MDIAYAELAETLETKEKIAQDRANASAIRQDGRVEVSSLSDALLVQRVDFHIAGSAVNGTNVAQQFEVFQAGKLRKIVAHAKTAPSSAEFTAILTSGATVIENVSISNGQVRGSSNGHLQEIPGGGPLRINVTSAGGAANVTISVFYSVG